MAGSWGTLNNVPSGLAAETMLLMTDGSVLVHNTGGTTGAKDWYRLTPDSQGKYETGSWSSALNMINTRLYFASGVLADGRVYVVGGEVSDDTSVTSGNDSPKGEVFDPVANSWSAMTKPAAFSFIQGDASSCVLADGRVLFGGLSVRTAVWDPSNDSWAEAGLAFGASSQTKQANSNEETWTLLPDGSVLTVEAYNPNFAERYIPSIDKWVSCGKTPQQLPVTTQFDSVTNSTVNVFEIGPALLLPNGKVFAIGATGHTALYTPAPNNDPTKTGSWASGPDFPADTTGTLSTILTSIDAPACLLPGGKVICVAGSMARYAGPPLDFFSIPTTFFEYDPTTNKFTQLTNQPSTNTGYTWQGRFLLLPSGQMLFSANQGTIAVYTPDSTDGTSSASWKPTITAFPAIMISGHTYTLSGTQFNGLSQAVSYGDDAQMATNFPIVRLTNTASNTVQYLRSFNFSSMGVATGSATQTASVEVPFGLVTGPWQLSVIANGIASDPVTVDLASQDCYFEVESSIIGQGQVQALIKLNNGGTGTVSPAVTVVVEGFNPSDFGIAGPPDLANPPFKPTVSVGVGQISAVFNGPVLVEDPALPNSPQKFRFPFDLVFQDATPFNFAGATENVLLSATFTSASGSTVSNSSLVELTKNPNPYILHNDPKNAKGEWYLSIDLRVFQATSASPVFAETIGTTGTAQSIATGFIQNVISDLNNNTGTARATFDGLPQEEDSAQLAIYPADTHNNPVYNFALARVRYRDLTQTATNVRVFFRLWPAQQTNATYDTTTTYRRLTNTEGQPIPVLGVQGDEITTIPFFASPRPDSSLSLNNQTDDPNRRDIGPDATGNEVDAYFGCWLDINQPNDLRYPSRILNGVNDGPFVNEGALLPILQFVRSTHQCLLAEVAFDPDPIPSTADPSISDKLAQRNLSFVSVPNPGLSASRRAPQTFEVRPTPSPLSPVLKPDELLIDWGNTPKGSHAQIYLPAVSASDILATASDLYTTHRLSLVDPQTLSVPAEGMTYIPIPQGQRINFAGLLTLDLPGTVKKGEIYDITVRQLTGVSFGRRGVASIQARRPAASTSPDSFTWRRVLGMFHLRIPVSTKHALLAPEERLLSVLRWIEEAIPVSSRWYPVFQRYVGQIAGRVGSLGGNPIVILPSPTGDGHPPHHPGHPGHGGGHGGGHGHEPGHEHEHVHEFTGKVKGIVFDHFGDFDGFLLETCEGDTHRFRSREGRVEDLVRRAWVERTLVTVIVAPDRPERPLSIILHTSAPATG